MSKSVFTNGELLAYILAIVIGLLLQEPAILAIAFILGGLRLAIACRDEVRREKSA